MVISSTAVEGGNISLLITTSRGWQLSLFFTFLSTQRGLMIDRIIRWTERISLACLRSRHTSRERGNPKDSGSNSNSRSCCAVFSNVPPSLCYLFFFHLAVFLSLLPWSFSPTSVAVQTMVEEKLWLYQ